jgi:hypothetical protein
VAGILLPQKVSVLPRVVLRFLIRDVAAQDPATPLMAMYVGRDA